MKFSDTIEKLRYYVDMPDINGCWLWKGGLYPNGYAMGRFDGRQRLVHRWTYEHFIGSIPSKLELDHKCRVRNCVNPFHLEPVTRKENANRSPLVSRWNFNMHCVNGHAMTAENTYMHGVGKYCKMCHRLSERSRREKQRILPSCVVSQGHNGCRTN